MSESQARSSRRRPWLGGGTRLLLVLSVIASGLVQTQRSSPATIALSSSVADLVQRPLAALAAFCHLDGLTIGFALWLQALSCASNFAEHAVTTRSRARPELKAFGSRSRARKSPLSMYLTGHVLYAFLLGTSLAFLTAVACVRPVELPPARCLEQAALLLAYVAASFTRGQIKQSGNLVLPDGWLAFVVRRADRGTVLSHRPAPAPAARQSVRHFRPIRWQALLPVSAAMSGDKAVRVLAPLGIGVLLECMDLLPLPGPKQHNLQHPRASRQLAAKRAGRPADGLGKGSSCAPVQLSRRAGTLLLLFVASSCVQPNANSERKPSTTLCRAAAEVFDKYRAPRPGAAARPLPLLPYAQFMRRQVSRRFASNPARAERCTMGPAPPIALAAQAPNTARWSRPILCWWSRRCVLMHRGY